MGYSFSGAIGCGTTAAPTDVPVTRAGIMSLVVSAPFGNWVSSPHATSTIGTFTLKDRGGLAWRMWRCLLTLRYHWGLGFVNRLGLPNPGLPSLAPGDYSDKVISVFGFDKHEWGELGRIAAGHRPLAVELNLSCPNVGHKAFLADVTAAVDPLLSAGVTVIAKLPPCRWMSLARPMYDYGVRAFHCCNTMPTPAGGLSGKPLKQYSLWAVEEIKQAWGSAVTVIGGGGVDSVQDVADYRLAGADHVAVGSMLINPWNWYNLEALAGAASSKKG